MASEKFYKRLRRTAISEGEICGPHGGGCGESLAGMSIADVNIDHLIPWSFASLLAPPVSRFLNRSVVNLQVMHKECNTKKHGYINGFISFDCKCHGVLYLTDLSEREGCVSLAHWDGSNLTVYPLLSYAMPEAGVGFLLFPAAMYRGGKIKGYIQGKGGHFLNIPTHRNQASARNRRVLNAMDWPAGTTVNLAKDFYVDVLKRQAEPISLQASPEFEKEIHEKIWRGANRHREVAKQHEYKAHAPDAKAYFDSSMGPLKVTRDITDPPQLQF